ncbi:MAG TPA: hypothetical protein IGS51_03430 [Thermoleptolyngbya sp. M55_K2018_002]|nr:hypothetical protein [Thermoleptolyngbya sp. M55_K2018_002]
MSRSGAAFGDITLSGQRSCLAVRDVRDRPFVQHTRSGGTILWGVSFVR